MTVLCSKFVSIYRAGLGITTLLFFLSSRWWFELLCTESGFLPASSLVRSWHGTPGPSLFLLFRWDPMNQLLLFFAVVASLCVFLGFTTRASATILAALYISLLWRNPFAWGVGEWWLALLLLLSPILSLEGRWSLSQGGEEKVERFWAWTAAALPFPVMVMQFALMEGSPSLAGLALLPLVGLALSRHWRNLLMVLSLVTMLGLFGWGLTWWLGFLSLLPLLAGQEVERPHLPYLAGLGILAVLSLTWLPFRVSGATALKKLAEREQRASLREFSHRVVINRWRGRDSVDTVETQEIETTRPVRLYLASLLELNGESRLRPFAIGFEYTVIQDEQNEGVIYYFDQSGLDDGNRRRWATMEVPSQQPELWDRMPSMKRRSEKNI